MLHFSLEEFFNSPTARELKLDNYPPPQVIPNIQKLVSYILDPLRDALGAPIRITSGYRCVELNTHLKGARNSQHRTGEAADIKVTGFSSKHVCEAIISLRLPFDQLINEFNSWTHVSFAVNGKPRGQYLFAMKNSSNKTIYVPQEY